MDFNPDCIYTKDAVVFSGWFFYPLVFANGAIAVIVALLVILLATGAIYCCNENTSVFTYIMRSLILMPLSIAICFPFAILCFLMTFAGNGVVVIAAIIHLFTLLLQIVNYYY